MRKLKKSDILNTSGSFVVNGSDKKPYKFNVSAVFMDDSKAFAWCIARPDISIKGIGKEDSVLFKVTQNPKKDLGDLVELVQDDKTIDEVFNAWNEYVDKINKGKK